MTEQVYTVARAHKGGDTVLSVHSGWLGVAAAVSEYWASSPDDWLTVTVWTVDGGTDAKRQIFCGGDPDWRDTSNPCWNLPEQALFE